MEPQSERDGDRVTETASLSTTDTRAVPGERYYYAIYSRRGEAISPTAAVVGPVMCVEDVGNLVAIGGDGCVTLNWEAPERATAIEVWRKEGEPPTRRGDGERLSYVTLNSARDFNLRNSVFYGYRVIAVFQGLDEDSVYSDGALVTTIPTHPPEPVGAVCVTRKRDDLEVTWKVPRVGDVQIYVTETRPSYEMGERLSISKLDEFGHQIPIISPGVARGTIGSPHLAYVVPVTVSGLTAVVGQIVSSTWVEDVDQLHVSVEKDTLSARWKWPAGIDAALVAFRPDQYSVAPTDPTSIVDLCIRTKYEREGEYRRHVPSLSQLFITVYAAQRSGGQWHYASGCKPGARRQITPGRYRQLRYRIGRIGGLVFLFSRQRQLIIEVDEVTELPELLLVAKAGGLPLHPRNGVVVLRIECGSVCKPGQPLKIPFSTDMLPRRWKARLFPADDNECEYYEFLPVPAT